MGIKHILSYSLIFIGTLLLSAKNADTTDMANYINRYTLSGITMQDGLPHVFVDDVVKDSRGYLWLSTMGGGVSRYDGYEFVSFSTNTEEYKLKSNFISHLCEDRFDRLWVAGDDGIDLISINSLNVVTPDISSSVVPFMDSPITGMILSSSGNLWVCSKNILYKMVFADNGEVSDVIKVSYVNTNERGVAMCEIGGYIWFQKDNMLCRVSDTVTEWQEPIPVSASLASLFNQSVFCMYVLNNEVWIGTSFGLLRYSILTDSVRHYMYNRDNPYSLSQNYITDITSAGDGTLIIGTLMGLNIYNPVYDSFQHIINDDEGGFGSSSQLNSNFVNVLYYDKGNDMVWIGTETGGLTKLYASRLYVTNYLHQQNQAASLSRNLVNSIVEDSDGTLWVGVVEGGINCKPKGKNGFIHFTTDIPAGLSHNTVSSLVLDSKERLYIGTWGGGIGWINRKMGSTKQFKRIDGIDDLFISTLCYDSINNLLWIGSQHGVYVYNPRNNRVDRLFRDTEKEININALGACITKAGDLWLSSVYGLLRIDLKAYSKGELKYRKYTDGVHMPESERITCVLEADNGDLWIGSNGAGIYRAVNNNDDYTFSSYTVSDGLISNNVRGIQEDWYGNIWITTVNGLSRYYPKDDMFVGYTSNDGLPSDIFYWNATAVSGNGEKIYLGSLGGLSEIHPLMEKESRMKFPLVINRINVFGKTCNPEDGVLELHERDKSLTIEFAALDYNPSSLAAYSYRLVGFDDNWIDARRDRRTVTYTNLKPGKYNFQLRYTPDGKNWIDAGNGLIIEVTPYFYKTPWFVLSVLLFIILVGYRIVVWRFNEMKRQQIILHDKVEERTRELKEQQKLLSVQTEELSKQNELLKEQNLKITEQKNKILEMSRKVEELTIDKLTFFTNITHEFRTPLTLIVGPIERALKLSYNPQVIEQLNLVEKNSKYLLSLINQLLDFRKVEDGRMKIICHHGNISTFLDDLLSPFVAFAADRGITLRIYRRIDNPYMMYDEDIMRKVITNIISNAIKFTEKGGLVSVYVAIVKDNSEEKLYMCVRDTGRGIPEDDIERIFNRFYQADNQGHESVSGQSGTGIGLYLCKKLITLLGGNVTAMNNPVVGSSFRILLPVERGENTETVDEVYDDEHEDVSLSQEKNGKLNILIVEDNKDMRDYIRSILAEYYNVIEASNGEEALQVLKSTNVDFVISDLMMPVMDGMELSHRIRSDFSISHIPILMLTAKTSDEARLEGYKTGVDSYLLKPFDENMLLARISGILENRKRFQQKFYLTMDVDSLGIEEESGDKKFLDKAIKVVKENYMNPNFDVADFVDAMGVSKSLLNKKMQSLTGQSTNQFVRNYRLNLARELLIKNRATHNMNISEIAYEVGFNDPKYFTRCFTKHFNVTPSSIMDDKQEDLR